MPELRDLWEIQVLDGQRKALEVKLREGQMSGELKSLKNEIEKGRAIFNKLKEEYNFLKKELKTREMDVAAVNEQAGQLGQKLYDGSITNVKEINSSSKKLDSLKDKVVRAEDEMLAIMERRDSLRARLEGMSAELNRKAEVYRRLHGSYLANQQKVRQLLAQIPLTRQKLLDRVDADLWKKYLEMKKSFSEPLARVEKGTCMGCRVGTPFNDLRLLKQGEGLVFCSHCGRMLYWER